MVERHLTRLLVTGGCGFIGTNFVRFLLEQGARDDSQSVDRVVNIDKLTYAGNPASLADLEGPNADRYRFVHGDIQDQELVSQLIREEEIQAIVNFAAESHVDRSILGPRDFVTTNVIGTFALLEAARSAWVKQDGAIRDDVVFHHVSTDEVYGSLGDTGLFVEQTPYDPRSPYSASKAASDHFVRAYHHTYGLPVTLTNCSNNYGPYQFPEKLIPLMILNIVDRKPLPIYGDGMNVRDWLFVADHNRAVWQTMRRAQAGSSYNIGGRNEQPNIRIVEALCDIVASETGFDSAELRSLMTFVKDRPGHDRRYAVDCSAIKRDLGWSAKVSFKDGLRETVRWYLDNTEWVDSVRSGEYRSWIHSNYTNR